jgi:uncharacterized membrane protein
MTREVMLEEPEEFAHEVVRNCSLSRSGRTLALAVMGSTTLSIGLGISIYYGAWPVLPYAGLELLVLWLGFRWIAGHDGDYERITVRGEELRHEVQVRQQVQRRSWNRRWSTLMCRTRGSRVELRVRSHGHEAEIGRMMLDEDRTRLADALRGLVRVQKITF